MCEGKGSTMMDDARDALDFGIAMVKYAKP